MDRGAWWATVHVVANGDTTEQLTLHASIAKHNSIGKLKGWKKIYYESFNKKEAGVAILISDKTDFRAKKITR